MDVVNVSLLKAVIRRIRPAECTADMVFVNGPAKFTFPSGRASRATFACGFVIIGTAPIWIKSILITWGLAVGVTLVLTRQNFLFDVVGAFVVGGIQLIAVF